jgi:response regulator RpfG family c-di-GMP phosphodiesterase
VNIKGIPEENPVVPSTHTSARCLNVLLVESDADSRALLNRVLSAAAYHVHTADSSAQAREVAAELGDDLDVVMAPTTLPDGDGVGLMSELHDLFGCRTICLTGNPGAIDDEDRCFHAGIDRCVPRVVMLGVPGSRGVRKPLTH